MILDLDLKMDWTRLKDFSFWNSHFVKTAVVLKIVFVSKPSALSKQVRSAQSKQASSVLNAKENDGWLKVES